MRLGITISAVSHAALIAVGLMSFGQADAFDPQEIEAIPIELVPIEEFSNIRQGSLDSNVIETETPSAVDADAPAELAQPLATRKKIRLRRKIRRTQALHRRTILRQNRRRQRRPHQRRSLSSQSRSRNNPFQVRQRQLSSQHRSRLKNRLNNLW